MGSINIGTSQNTLEYTVSLVKRAAKDIIKIVNITSTLPAMICKQSKDMIIDYRIIYLVFRIIYLVFILKKSSKLKCGFHVWNYFITQADLMFRLSFLSMQI